MIGRLREKLHLVSIAKIKLKNTVLAKWAEFMRNLHLGSSSGSKVTAKWAELLRICIWATIEVKLVLNS
jgi:hypothetical protein